MPQPSPQQTARLTRYHAQSVRLLRDAISEARQSRWLRCEELLWGSATLAVKSVALTRGDDVDGRQAIEAYAQTLGRRHNDRRIRDAFTRLNSFADLADRIHESRADAQRLAANLEQITAAIERLWGMLPPSPTSDAPDPPPNPNPAPPPQRRPRQRRPRQRRINDDDQ